MNFIKKYKIIITITVIILTIINFYFLWLGKQNDNTKNDEINSKTNKNINIQTNEEINTTENKDISYKLLEIGTVVLLKDSDKEIMISGRNILRNNNEPYDYMAYLYPEGNMGNDYNIFFDHDAIKEIIKSPQEEEINTLDENLIDIGTVVLLNQGKKELIITGKNVIRINEDNKKYDYVAALYPEGFISDDYNIFFNHDSIAKVVKTLKNINK